jgi:hypothetical protein
MSSTIRTLCFLGILFTSSCKQQESPFTALLTAKNTCWEYQDYPLDENGIPFGCITFYKDGTSQIFQYTEEGRRPWFHIDGQWPNNWSFSSSTHVLALGEAKPEESITVMRYNHDTIFTKDHAGYRRVLLRR